jgi:hypothetical protein
MEADVARIVGHETTMTVPRVFIKNETTAAGSCGAVYEYIEGSGMQVPELCSKCGAAGSVRRELVINGANSSVSCYCTRCGQKWEIADQRAQSEHSDRLPERRNNVRHSS